MSLTKEDLQAIRSLMQEEISASEKRMTTKISESEQRMTTHLNTVIESELMPKIRQIADGHTMLAEKMNRIETKVDNLSDTVDEIKGELAAQELVITRRFPVAK